MNTIDTTEFYITIPNWGSDNYFQDNTISDFRVQLPQPVDLRGVWSVGLSQIQYCKTWYNVEQDNFIYITWEGKTSKVSPTPGYYTTAEQLVNKINEDIKEQTNIDQVRFTFSPLNGKCTIEITPGVTVYMSSILRGILGIKKSVTEKSETGERLVNLNLHTEAIYIYCDLIEDQIVGEEKWKLIRFLNVENKNFGESITRSYDDPQYISLAKKYFETIHIRVCNQNKETIDFLKGICIVQLHFKLSKIPIFY